MGRRISRNIPEAGHHISSYFDESYVVALIYEREYHRSEACFSPHLLTLNSGGVIASLINGALGGRCPIYTCAIMAHDKIDACIYKIPLEGNISNRMKSLDLDVRLGACKVNNKMSPDYRPCQQITRSLDIGNTGWNATLLVIFEEDYVEITMSLYQTQHKAFYGVYSVKKLKATCTKLAGLYENHIRNLAGRGRLPSKSSCGSPRHLSKSESPSSRKSSLPA